MFTKVIVSSIRDLNKKKYWKFECGKFEYNNVIEIERRNSNSYISS